MNSKILLLFLVWYLISNTLRAQELDGFVAIDSCGELNETIQEIRSGLKWGAFNTGASGRIAINPDGKLRFDAEAVAGGSYVYTTSFAPLPAHDVIVQVVSVQENLKVRLLLREYYEGEGTDFQWIVSSEIALKEGKNHFNVEDLWWDRLAAENSYQLDLLADADEFPINIPDDNGYGSIPINKLQGGGLLISSTNGNGTLEIDSIYWTRFCSDCDDTQVNFQPEWKFGDLDCPIDELVTYRKVPYVVSPTRITGLYTGGKVSGTPVACVSSNIEGKREPPIYFKYPGPGHITYQVYVCEPDSHIVALCISNPVAGTRLKLSARPVESKVENSFTITLPETRSPDPWNFKRIILDEHTDGMLYLDSGYNYITAEVLELAGSFMNLQLIELVKIEAKPLVQAEAAEAELLRANMEWWFGKRGFMVENHRPVYPRFGPQIPYKENVRDWDIEGFVRDIKTMGGEFVNFRVLHNTFPGNVQAVEDLWPGSTPFSWAETNRDFIMDLADSLNAHGIKLTLLLGRSGFGGGGSNNARQWMYQMTKVLNGIGNHYVDKVAGYQFDGGHNNRNQYPRLKNKPIILATKTGQIMEDRGSGANWSSLTLTDPWQEFTLREGHGPPSYESMKDPFWTYGNVMWDYGPGEWGKGTGLKSAGGPKITKYGNAHRLPDTPIAELRNTDEVLFPWVKECLENGGMVTQGAEAYQTPYEGSYFSPDQVNQMTRLTAYLEEDTSSVINQAPSIELVFTDTTIAEGSTIRLTANVTDDGLPNPPAAMSYKWTVKTGEAENVTIATDDQITTEVSISKAGFYVLNLEANDGELSGNEKLTLYVTPGVGVGSFPGPVIKLYPNPAFEQLNIDLPEVDRSSSNLRIYNGSGELVYTVETTETRVSIDISNFEEGLYLIVVNTGVNCICQKLKILKLS